MRPDVRCVCAPRRARALFLRAAAACTLLAVLWCPGFLETVADAKPTTQDRALPGQARGQSLPRADESVILNVPASSPWTDAGVTLRSGDRVEIQAWGRVRYGGAKEGADIGPAGAGRGGGCSYVVADPRVTAHALVANVAPGLTFDGAGLLVGAKWSATVPVAGTTAPEGRLFLGVNHGGMLCDRTGFDSWGFRNDSAGAFTAQLVIRRRH